MKKENNNSARTEISARDKVRFQETLYHSSNPTRRWLHQNRSKWITLSIDRECHKNEVILAVDIGSGIGVYLPHMSEKCERVISLDIDPVFLYASRDKGPSPNIDFVNGDIRSLPFPDDCAGLVLCSEVLEHVPESQICLQEIHRILKPGAKLVFSTPQPYSLMEITARIALSPFFLPVTRLIYQEPVYSTGHINLMNGSKIRSLLTNQGFIIDEFFCSGLYLPFFAELFPNLTRTVAAAIEPAIRNNFLSPLLWTQFYVATKTGD